MYRNLDLKAHSLYRIEYLLLPYLCLFCITRKHVCIADGQSPNCEDTRPDCSKLADAGECYFDSKVLCDCPQSCGNERCPIDKLSSTFILSISSLQIIYTNKNINTNKVTYRYANDNGTWRAMIRNTESGCHQVFR
jgi:hypothetical protein